MPKLKNKYKHLRGVGFQNLNNCNTRLGKGPSVVDVKYVRLSEASFNSRIHKHGSVLTFKDVDGSDTHHKPLRPSADKPSYIDRYGCKPRRSARRSDVHPDLLTNKLYEPAKVVKMFNIEFKRHMSLKQNCKGNLQIDGSASRKWGLCWQERLKCSNCSYVSAYYKLYEELNSKGRGRKAARANVGFQIGLTTTSIGNAGARRILNHANIISPSKAGMQGQSNSVCESLKVANEHNLRSVRRALVTENTMVGQKNPNMINVEGDCCYNNPLFNVDATPFQAGTIATATLVENNSRHKRIVGVHVASKLCLVASRLRASGKHVVCPNHRGICTANMAENESIGQEGKYYSSIANSLKSDDIGLANFTSDGDSKGYVEISKTQTNPVGHFKDLRHLGNSMRRAINKAPFSKNMLGPKSKVNLRSRFALSIKSRCMSELKAAHKAHNSDLSKIRQSMPDVVDTIVLCFKGYCGANCKKYSHVCPGNFRQAKNYLPSIVRIKMTSSDELVLKRCINMVLGHDNLSLTKLLTTTQKCEAVNRSYTAVTPKSVTFSRNASGRIHGQVLKLNNGYGNSAVIKTCALGAPITPGSQIIRQLKATDKELRASYRTHALTKRKLARAATRARKFKMHEQIHYKTGVSDPKPDFRGIHGLKDHNYS